MLVSLDYYNMTLDPITFCGQYQLLVYIWYFLYNLSTKNWQRRKTCLDNDSGSPASGQAYPCGH